MLDETINKVDRLFCENGGYLRTRDLRANKITNFQIKQLVEGGYIEKIAYGFYWNNISKKAKPSLYKYIEIMMNNPKAVFIGASALFLQGLIEAEPQKVFVATARSDRKSMRLNFEISRHFFSEREFKEKIDTKTTLYCELRMYGIDRSVADAIRFRDEISDKLLEIIVDEYKYYDERNEADLLEYAQRMQFGKTVREYID